MQKCAFTFVDFLIIQIKFEVLLDGYQLTVMHACKSANVPQAPDTHDHTDKT